MSDQIDGLTATARDEPARGLPGPPGAAVVDSRATTGARRPPSGCGTGSPRCTGRCSATLGAMLGDCWDRHPLCLAYLDTLHEAWCLLYIPERDPKMVFAQLDWLTRPLLQAAEVMARETSGCRSGHREPGQLRRPRGPALAQRPPLTPLQYTASLPSASAKRCRSPLERHVSGEETAHGKQPDAAA